MKRITVLVILMMVLLMSACGKVDNASNSQSEAVNSTEENTLQSQEETPENSESVTGSTEPSQWAEGESTVESQMTEEEYWQAYLDTLAYPTRKDEYAEAIYQAICSLPEEKPASDLKQKDVDCDTLQWFNATYAMFVNGNGDDFHYIGGYNDESNSRKDYLSDQLDKSWGITDRATAIETLSWLTQEGHTYEFAELVQLMDMMGFLSGTGEEIQQYFNNAVLAGEIAQEDVEASVEFYSDMQEIYAVCGENGIDGWDYCRIMQLCGNCYFLGYITLEESLTIQLAVAQAIQDQFDSWTEINDSYYYGYSYWNYGSYMVSFRKNSYDELMEMEDSPYKLLDFNMPLEKFW